VLHVAVSFLLAAAPELLLERVVAPTMEGILHARSERMSATLGCDDDFWGRKDLVDFQRAKRRSDSVQRSVRRWEQHLGWR
jgi:hypothetical protein